MARASKPDAAKASGDFGPGATFAHGKRDGGQGIKAEAMAAKPLEAAYIEPEQRNNPDYLAKLAKEKSERPKGPMGFSVQAKVFGASPNSPLARVNVLR